MPLTTMALLLKGNTIFANATRDICEPVNALEGDTKDIPGITTMIAMDILRRVLIFFFGDASLKSPFVSSLFLFPFLFFTFSQIDASIGGAANHVLLLFVARDGCFDLGLCLSR